MLKVDKLGNLYETSPDREDGKGFKSYPTPVSTGDVTFGAIHSKSLDAHAKSVKRDMMNRAEEDRQKNVRAIQNMNRKVMMGARADAEQKLRDNEDYQENLVRTGVQQSQMGCDCDSSYSQSGNGLSANGLKGPMGLDRTQRAIRHHVSGIGADTAYAIDPVEAYQAQLKDIANQMIVAQARLDAKRNDAEDKASQAMTPKQGIFSKSYSGQIAPNVLIHPMQLATVKVG